MRPTFLISIVAVFVVWVSACVVENGSALADALARGDALFEAANNEKETKNHVYRTSPRTTRRRWKLQ